MINVLIMCPEITKGMKSIGSKCLLKLRKNMSVIEHQIKEINVCLKKPTITINTGFDHENIKSCLTSYKNINFLYNPNYMDTNQGKNIILYLEQYNPKNLLIINNGVLIKDNFLSKKNMSDNCALFFLNKQKENFNIGTTKEEKIEYLFYDMDDPWSEICYLNETAINILNDHKNKTRFDQMYVFEIINFLLEKNITFDKIYSYKSKIMKINNIKDLPKAKVFI